MLNTHEKFERRTAADDVFDRLYNDIVSLRLVPGTKLPEAEVAKRFGVSRQPIRDAFNRLGSIGLLTIRPQRATEVRGFSMERISHSRFVRLAIELEVVNRACKVWDYEKVAAVQSVLDKQRDAIEGGNTDIFHSVDLEFHELICELSGHPNAAFNISECKQELDRLCFLCLSREDEATTLYQDHLTIAEALSSNDTPAAQEATRLHLSRLDSHIEEIFDSHQDFFES